MLSPMKSLLAFALIAALAVFAGGALAANGGNSGNAKLCQDWPAADGRVGLAVLERGRLCELRRAGRGPSTPWPA